MRKKTSLPSRGQARLIKKLERSKNPLPQKPLDHWQKLRETSAEVKPLDYDPGEKYREEQAITHPTFGLGFVSKVIDASKIEVVFERQVKILVMNRPKSGQE
jgi:hypothetical protein